jgi:2-desacetyl-2-hydroxyethyl bacteriochlorophyllide A dehydrogenase
MESLNVVFSRPEEPAIVREQVGEPDAGQALCRTTVSAISTGTESFCLGGRFDPGTNWAGWVRYPFHPGYCASAVVEAIGGDAGVANGLEPGRRVAARVSHRQAFVASAASLIPIPEGVTDEDAAFVPLAITAQQGVRRAAIELGETAVVVGAGLIGLFTVQYLALLGCRRIIVVDTATTRLELASRLGATDALHADVAAAREAVADLTSGRMADVVFEATGAAPVLEHATTLLRRLGRCVMVGDSPTPSAQRMGPRIVSDSISLLGIHMTMSPREWSEFSPWSYEEMVSLIFDYVASKRMNIADMITHRHGPEDAPDVYRRLLADRSGVLGVVFDWSRLGS